MGEFFGSLRELGVRLWRPWSADPSERKSADVAAHAVFTVWLACVPISIWIAAGEPPWWLAGLTLAVLLVLGCVYFFVIGLPSLATPLFHVWQATPQEGDAANDGPDEWQATYEERAKWTEKMKAKGVLREDYQLPPKERGDFQEQLDRWIPGRPALNRTAKIAGGVLIVALILGDHPLLATLYAFPSLGWLAMDGLKRILPPRQGI